MAPDVNKLRGQAVRIARHPRSRKIAIWLVSIFAAIGVLLGLIAPPLIRGKLASALSDRLHRPVTIEQLKINPYAMTVTVRGFVVKERQAQSVAVSFDELFINLELRSFLRLAPVIKQLRLTKPYVNLVRNGDRTYNFQDLLTGPKSEGGGPPPRFALQNIEIVDGRIDFDDRPESTRHSITDIRIGIPFISSLPSYADVYVKPSFSAVVNGAALHLAGETKPFKDTQESTISVSIDKLAIAKYLEYSPVALNFKVAAGELKGKLTASFRAAKNAFAVLSISGHVGLEKFEMQEGGGAPLLKLPFLEVSIDGLEVFARKAAVKSVKAQGLELHLVRNRDGAFNVKHLVVAPPQAEAVKTEIQAEGQGFQYSIGEIALESTTIHFQDQAAARLYKTRLDNLTAKVTGLTNEPEKRANVELSFETDAKESFSHSGTLQLSPLRLEGKLDIGGLRPGALQPYYQNALTAEVKDGSLDLSTQYSYEKKGEAAALKLAGLNALLKSFRLELAGQPEPLWHIGSLAVKDASIDVANQSIVIGAIEARDGTNYIQRDKDGTVNYARIAKKSDGEPAVAPPATEGKPAAPWNIEAKEIVLDRFKFSWDDRAVAAPAKMGVSDLSLRAQNLSTAKNRTGRAVLQARVNGAGTLRLAGPVSISPVHAKLAVEAKGLDVVLLQSYLADDFNFVLTGGRAGTKGELTVDGNGPGPLKITYAGTAEVADFGSLEKTSSQDLLKWKSLTLDGLQLATQPFGLRIGEITLSDFYSRLIIHPDGKTNLQTLRNPDGNGKEPAAPDALAEQKTPPEPASPKASPGKPAPDGDRRTVTIGKINLKSGNINFSDFFIKPNYSANLTDVEGAISELKPQAPGDLDLKAKLDDAAPVEIKGKINPLSQELFLDIVADAREIELNPFTPYSGKYVGYGIEKGKLSFNVKYHLENRQLSGQNKIILNQLTFGERMESPTATKLPVLLAVALLKDRNGVIDVDLPISGSLDDPQFSVGGIVLRIIINLITRAVTAPFTLIASVFGGGSGEELSYIEFDPGRSNLDQPHRAKIATLARALNNRPALNLEITGRFDPLTDLDGLKRVGIERKVRAQKLRDLLRRGQAPRSVDEVQVDANEYAKYLKDAYGEETFPKPRNVIGLARDLPVPEMEKLMMQHAKVSDDDLRRLGDERAQAVRNALLRTGQVGAERLFVVASKGFSTEERAKLKGRPNRIDFSMR